MFQLADPELFEHAPCVNKDPDYMFPEGTGSAARLARNEAKKLCIDCPVETKAACLKAAMDDEGVLSGDGRYGIYGGLDEHERARLALGLPEPAPVIISTPHIERRGGARGRSQIARVR